MRPPFALVLQQRVRARLHESLRLERVRCIELAARMGVNKSTISRFRDGALDFGPEKLAALQSVLSSAGPSKRAQRQELATALVRSVPEAALKPARAVLTISEPTAALLALMRHVLLLHAVERCDGNLTAAGELLGVSRRWVEKRVKGSLDRTPSPHGDGRVSEVKVRRGELAGEALARAPAEARALAREIASFRSCRPKPQVIEHLFAGLLVLQSEGDLKAAARLWKEAERNFSLRWRQIERSVAAGALTEVAPAPPVKRRRYRSGVIPPEQIRARQELAETLIREAPAALLEHAQALLTLPEPTIALIASVQRALFLDALARCDGNVAAVVRMLRVSSKRAGRVWHEARASLGGSEVTPGDPGSSGARARRAVRARAAFARAPLPVQAFAREVAGLRTRRSGIVVVEQLFAGLAYRQCDGDLEAAARLLGEPRLFLGRWKRLERFAAAERLPPIGAREAVSRVDVAAWESPIPASLRPTLDRLIADLVAGVLDALRGAPLAEILAYAGAPLPSTEAREVLDVGSEASMTAACSSPTSSRRDALRGAREINA
jgi:hypothetical protein